MHEQVTLVELSQARQPPQGVNTERIKVGQVALAMAQPVRQLGDGPLEHAGDGQESPRPGLAHLEQFEELDARLAVPGEWLVGQELSGAPSLTLRAYRITDGAFASSPGDGISAIALLGPKK